MATVTIFDPDSGKTKTVSVTMEASMIIQDLQGELDFFVSVSTSARDVSGNAISRKDIKSLADGAGGTGLDRFGVALSGGVYADLSTAIEDYVALIVEGTPGSPETEMAFE